MADERRVFPTETVLELACGKKGADVSDIAAFILSRPVASEAEARAAAPFAAAWLASLQPGFAKLDWQDDGDWKQFVANAKNRLGDHISLVPMSGQIAALANGALNSLEQSHDSLVRQTEAAAKLEQRVKELEPLEGALNALQKKYDELEAKLKATKSEMAACQRKLNEYDGKAALDESELVRKIQDAIKDGLKGVTVGGAAACAAAAMTEAETSAPVAEAAPAEEEWGFKTKRSKKNDW